MEWIIGVHRLVGIFDVWRGQQMRQLYGTARTMLGGVMKSLTDGGSITITGLTGKQFYALVIDLHSACLR